MTTVDAACTPMCLCFLKKLSSLVKVFQFLQVDLVPLRDVTGSLENTSSAKSLGRSATLVVSFLPSLDKVFSFFEPDGKIFTGDDEIISSAQQLIVDFAG